MYAFGAFGSRARCVVRPRRVFKWHILTPPRIMAIRLRRSARQIARNITIYVYRVYVCTAVNIATSLNVRIEHTTYILNSRVTKSRAIRHTRNVFPHIAPRGGRDLARSSVILYIVYIVPLVYFMR